MNRDIRIDSFGPIDFKNGIPLHLSQYVLSPGVGYHAKGPWGVICFQEIKTEKFLLRHFLFSLQKTISFYVQECNEGLQSLVSLRGEVAHSFNSLKTIHLREKEFILFDAGREETCTQVEAGNTTSLLNAYYTPDSYKNLLPFFPAFKKDLKKAKGKAFHFTFPPRPARYTVHDAINAIWFDRYIEHLQVKHINIRLESTLFTLLAQTYTPITQAATPQEREKAAAALEIILENIRQHLSAEEIAIKLHCSAGWLKKAFSKVYGVGMFQYLRRTRMQRAKEMLLAGESLKAVAIEVGMKPRNFPKEFKSFFGYTVTALKKGHQL